MGSVETGLNIPQPVISSSVNFFAIIQTGQQNIIGAILFFCVFTSLSLILYFMLLFTFII